MPEPARVPNQDAAPDLKPLLRAGLLLGVGLMGLLDGILFHQVLQWHHLVDQRTGSLATNLLADGLFHAASWLATLAGIALLARATRALGRGPARTRALLGSALLGAAAFNVLETLLGHFLLRLHWLHPSNDPLWDVGFLALNLAIALLAWRILRSHGALRLRRAERRHRRAPHGP